MAFYTISNLIFIATWDLVRMAFIVIAISPISTIFLLFSDLAIFSYITRIAYNILLITF